jgi:hypothetical protein
VSLNIFRHVCERNCNEKHLAMPFFAVKDTIKGGRNWVTKMATGSGNRSTYGISQKL